MFDGWVSNMTCDATPHPADTGSGRNEQARQSPYLAVA
ncbi:hypothetical protein BBOH_1020 [Bifidobacterium bohemicum DSM 22767]|uniref:Uncharacterized protein n=1 Tax=Bifidobacterium bohemicum DSM 22767 TaxID=1437606 RepID=A0A086ZGB8_9BIFI|nr:hypothetical protein BBOH_1020 [Bifidobacterium bohemicum DSM 22767]